MESRPSTQEVLALSFAHVYAHVTFLGAFRNLNSAVGNHASHHSETLTFIDHPPAVHPYIYFFPSLHIPIVCTEIQISQLIYLTGAIFYGMLFTLAWFQKGNQCILRTHYHRERRRYYDPTCSAGYRVPNDTEGQAIDVASVKQYFLSWDKKNTHIRNKVPSKGDQSTLLFRNVDGTLPINSSRIN